MRFRLCVCVRDTNFHEYFLIEFENHTAMQETLIQFYNLIFKSTFC